MSVVCSMIDLLKEFLTHERNRDLRIYALVLLLLALGIFSTQYLAGRLVPYTGPSHLIQATPLDSIINTTIQEMPESFP